MAENLAFKQERQRFQQTIQSLKRQLDAQAGGNDENVELYKMQVCVKFSC